MATKDEQRASSIEWQCGQIKIELDRIHALEAFKSTSTPEEQEWITARTNQLNDALNGQYPLWHKDTVIDIKNSFAAYVNWLIYRLHKSGVHQKDIAEVIGLTPLTVKKRTDKGERNWKENEEAKRKGEIRKHPYSLMINRHVVVYFYD